MVNSAPPKRFAPHSQFLANSRSCLILSLGTAEVDYRFHIEHSNERLVDLTPPPARFLPHSACQFDWKRTGLSHAGYGTKGACTLWRWITRKYQVSSPGESTPTERNT